MLTKQQQVAWRAIWSTFFPMGLWRSFFALLAPFVAFAFNALLWPWFGSGAWSLFYPAIFLSSWLGGLYIGLAGTFMSLFLCWLLAVSNTYVNTGDIAGHYLAMGVFTSMGVLFSVFHSLLTSTNKRLNRRETELTEAQRIASVGSWEFDFRTNCLSWSDEAYRILGLPPGAILPTWETFMQTVHPDDRAFVQRAADSVMRGGAPYNIDHRIVRTNGEERIVHSVAEMRFDSDGNPLEMIGTVHDITALKQADRDLRATFEKLAASEKTLKKQTEELRRSNADLEQFAYVTSHDLREPLRMVTNYAELLDKRYKGKLDASADKYIGYMVEGAMRMQNLVADLLNYSRIGRAEESVKVTDMNTLLEDVLKNIDASVKAANAEIVSDHLPTVRADPLLIRQVFQNLLSNAIKFRRPDVAPKVHLSAHQENNEWVFSVKDNGVGIDPQYAEKIFVIFQRLHSRSEFPGTGIGLAICKKIVERQGGKIWVESRPNNGSIFSFTLPINHDNDAHPSSMAKEMS
jgi:PAS domain S-box-containing protein